MSTAPSSIPPPSFDVAPELPAGVERPPPPQGPLWKPWMAWVGLIAAFGGALMGALIVGVIGAAAGARFDDPTPAISIASTVVQDISFIGAALLFASIAGRPRPEQFGLRPTRFWPAVGWIAITFGGFYAVTALWVAILGASPNDTKLPDELGVNDSTIAMLAVAFLVSVIAPVAEEFFFRGFFFTALRAWKGLWPAAVLTGIVFGAIHVGSADAVFLVPLGFFGFALCVLYHRTRSLYPCMTLHCLNNSVAFGVSQHWGWETLLLFATALSIISLGALIVRAKWTPATAPAG